MRNKMMSVLVAAAVCAASLTGCMAGSREYDAVKQAQQEVARLDSGRITLTSGYERPSGSGRVVTEFVFQKLESGNFAYCQTQFDRNNKPIYCEYSDGTTAEQWFIGKGWSSMTGGMFTADEPHRYIALLSTPQERKAIRSILATPEDTNCRYDITLDPDRLNETVYSGEDAEAVEERISLLLNEAGELICYNDEALVNDGQTGEQVRYMLEMQLSDRNSVGEVARPELRDNWRKE